VNIHQTCRKVYGFTLRNTLKGNAGPKAPSQDNHMTGNQSGSDIFANLSWNRQRNIQNLILAHFLDSFFCFKDYLSFKTVLIR
jgi:hypothetical protein